MNDAETTPARIAERLVDHVRISGLSPAERARALQVAAAHLKSLAQGDPVDVVADELVALARLRATAVPDEAAAAALDAIATDLDVAGIKLEGRLHGIARDAKRLLRELAAGRRVDLLAIPADGLDALLEEAIADAEDMPAGAERMATWRAIRASIAGDDRVPEALRTRAGIETPSRSHVEFGDVDPDLDRRLNAVLDADPTVDTSPVLDAIRAGRAPDLSAIRGAALPDVLDDAISFVVTLDGTIRRDAARALLNGARADRRIIDSSLLNIAQRLERAGVPGLHDQVMDSFGEDDRDPPVWPPAAWADDDADPSRDMAGPDTPAPTQAQLAAAIVAGRTVHAALDREGAIAVTTEVIRLIAARDPLTAEDRRAMLRAYAESTFDALTADAAVHQGDHP